MDGCGFLVTRPVRVDGDELRLNAATDRGGCIRVELTDEAAASLPGGFSSRKLCRG